MLSKPPWELLTPCDQPLLSLPLTPALWDALQPLVADVLPPTDALLPWLTAMPAVWEALLAVVSAPPQV